MDVSAATKGSEKASLKLRKCFVRNKRLTSSDRKLSDHDKNLLKRAQCRDYAKPTCQGYVYDPKIHKQAFLLYHNLIRRLINGEKVEDIDFNPYMRCVVNPKELSETDLKRTEGLNNLLKQRIYDAVYEPREIQPAVLTEVFDIMKHGGNLSGTEGDKVINLVKILKGFEFKSKCGEKMYVIKNTNPEIDSDGETGGKFNPKCSLKISLINKPIEIAEDTIPKIDMESAAIDKESAAIAMESAPIDKESAAIDVEAAPIDVEAAPIDVVAAPFGKLCHEFQCNICQKQFYSAVYYKKHLEIHRAEVGNEEEKHPTEMESEEEIHTTETESDEENYTIERENEEEIHPTKVESE